MKQAAVYGFAALHAAISNREILFKHRVRGGGVGKGLMRRSGESEIRMKHSTDCRLWISGTMRIGKVETPLLALCDIGCSISARRVIVVCHASRSLNLIGFEQFHGTKSACEIQQ